MEENPILANQIASLKKSLKKISNIYKIVYNEAYEAP